MRRKEKEERGIQKNENSAYLCQHFYSNEKIKEKKNLLPMNIGFGAKFKTVRSPYKFSTP